MENRRRIIRLGTGLRENAGTIVAGVLVSAVVVAFVINYYQRMHSQGAYRNEYEGRVANKWVTYHETEFGTRVSRHLLIKSKSGEAFQVVVSAELYEQAAVDLWVVKTKHEFKVLPAP